uniref:Putative thap domain protein n=1 Tax=Ixodes ricinus TaxID=34613 RepID=V5HCX6_IXORI
MPQRCSAVGCSNDSKRNRGLSFFRFPCASLHPTKRQLWIRAIRRNNADGSPWQPSDYSRVCGNHFEQGAPSRCKDHPDYVPSIFAYKPRLQRDSAARFDRARTRHDKKMVTASAKNANKASKQLSPPAVEQQETDTMAEVVDNSEDQCTLSTDTANDMCVAEDCDAATPLRDIHQRRLLESRIVELGWVVLLEEGPSFPQLPR